MDRRLPPDRVVVALSNDDLQRAYRYALSLTGERDRAFELVHGALEHWLAAPRGEVARPLAYLLRCVRNRFVDEVRHEIKFNLEPFEETSSIVPVDFSDLEGIIVDADHVRWLLERLTAAEREVLFLWAVEGYTIEQISVHTNIPRGTLLARLHRLRRKLVRLNAEQETQSGARR